MGTPEAKTEKSVKVRSAYHDAPLWLQADFDWLDHDEFCDILGAFLGSAITKETSEQLKQAYIDGDACYFGQLFAPIYIKEYEEPVHDVCDFGRSYFINLNTWFAETEENNPDRGCGWE